MSPVLYIQPDQRPSASVSNLVSFGGSDDELADELADDSMSLVASDAEELSGSVTDPVPSGLPAALHSMAVLQVYQAKLLSAVDESEPDPATLRELRSATDLALRATKTTAQAIGRSMASLVVLERHLWLTLTEIKDADRVSFLDAPISPSGLFGPAVKGFAERFTEAQKASQAMRHFLPKRSSPAAAQSRPRTAPTQQPTKPAPAVFAPQPARTQQPRGRSRSARRHPPPKRQGPRLKIALDPAPPASS